MTDEPLNLTKLSADELKRLLWQERNKHEQEVARLTARLAEARELIEELWSGYDVDRISTVDYEDISGRVNLWLEANPEPNQDGDHD